MFILGLPLLRSPFSSFVIACNGIQTFLNFKSSNSCLKCKLCWRNKIMIHESSPQHLISNLHLLKLLFVSTDTSL